jgi:hypothetical protein
MASQFFDRFFTFTRLMRMLLEGKTYAYGTPQTRSKDLPSRSRKPEV